MRRHQQQAATFGNERQNLATRAAVEEGIVSGVGVALARASPILSKAKADNDDQRFGIEIIRKAIQTPLRQIAENAGEDGAVIAGKTLENDSYNFGFDAQSGEFKDLVKAGIIASVPATSRCSVCAHPRAVNAARHAARL